MTPREHGYRPRAITFELRDRVNREMDEDRLDAIRHELRVAMAERARVANEAPTVVAACEGDR